MHDMVDAFNIQLKIRHHKNDEKQSNKMFYRKNNKCNSNLYSMMTMMTMVFFICNKVDGVMSDVPCKSNLK